jgi:uncharacterized lipoprotein YddW (UPF0748 family)
MTGFISDRRGFLKAAGLGLSALAGTGLLPRRARAATALKNWVWIPNGTERSADEWKRRFALLRASGVSAVLPEIYDGKNAYFASTRLPVKRDWLGEILPLARAEGLEVHGWMWSMPCLLDDIMKNHPDWYNVNAKGESAVDKPAYVPYYRFLDPGRPEVREWVQGTVKELAGIPELTGIHLDYIRHPDAILPEALWAKYGIVQDKVYPQYDYGYTPYERDRFKQLHGVDPMDGITDPVLQQAWLQFRWDMVDGLVNDYLVPAAHAKGKLLTAAVFPGPSGARQNVRQDWGSWHLDAFLPMLYNSFYKAGPEWVATETREGVAAVKQPIYSGLFVGAMDEAEFVQTAKLAIDAGASGLALFADDMMDDAKWQALRRLTDSRGR